jgi:hypothetical protein
MCSGEELDDVTGFSSWLSSRQIPGQCLEQATTASFHLGLIHRPFIILDIEDAVKYPTNICSYI